MRSPEKQEKKEKPSKAELIEKAKKFLEQKDSKKNLADLSQEILNT